MPQEHTLRHAYLIAAHDKPAQLRTLLALLNHPDNDIYLHIDRKATGFLEDELRAAAPDSRVYFAPRLDARWGDEVFIDVIVSLLRMACVEEHAYYHLLSGVDLPLQSQDEIHAFFAAHAGQEFVDFDSETVDAALLRQRIGRWHIRQPLHPLAKKAHRLMEACWLDLQKLLRVDRLKNCDVMFQKGAVWFSITHACAIYALRQADSNRACFARSVCADELWLQTALVGSPFMEKRAFSGFGDECAATMRFVDWSEGGRSPRVLRNEDYAALMESGMLFARKFDEAKDSEIIRRIVAHVQTGA